MEYKQKYQKLVEEIKINSVEGILKIIELYKESSAEQRNFVRATIDNKIAGQLLSYSYTAAIESVRKNSEEILLNGFIAQSIEDSKRDYRDNVVILFLLYSSAKKLGEDVNFLINKTAELSSPNFADLLIQFIKRTDLDLDLVKLSGYKMVEDPEFDYVWVGCRDAGDTSLKGSVNRSLPP